MREELKAELDFLLQSHINRGVERRRDPRLQDFDAHLEFLQSFASVQREIIVPAMSAFGAYLKPLGHGYFIGTRQEISDGHCHPVSTITFHLLLNHQGKSGTYPSLTFKADHTRSIFAIKKTDLFTAAMGSCTLDSVNAAFVENRLKDFTVEMLSARQLEQ